MRNRRGLFDPRNLHQLLRNERMAERGADRRTVRPRGVGLQAPHDVAVREFVAGIEHVCADGAGRQGAVAHFFQLAALSEVDRDGDDLGAVPLGQPRNGHRGGQASGKGEDDSLHLLGHSEE